MQVRILSPVQRALWMCNALSLLNSCMKTKNCKWCNLDITELPTAQKANHVRWCKLNPKRADYVATNAKTFLDPNRIRSNQYLKAKQEGTEVPSNYRKGKTGFSNGPLSEQAKANIKAGCLKSNHRRLCKSVRQYIKLDGTIVQLDSSWEEMLAIRLDALSINWVRPGPMKWLDSKGNWRNYFPDFYLPDHNLYLDPKNPCAYNQQIEKVTWLKANVSNLLFLLSVEDIEGFTI